MKKRFTMAFVLSIFSTTYAQNSYVAELIGTWNTTQMICTDGQAPHIPFVAGRDSAQLNYDGANFKSTLTIMGQSQIMTGSYTVAQNLITMTDAASGVTGTVGYMINKNNELLLIDGDAYCNPGKALITTLVKQ